jgi:tellurite methyltransferase
MAPSAFVAEWVARFARRSTFELRAPTDRQALGHRSPCDVQPTALDVAMGRGRHAVVLARAGFKTFGVDTRLDAVRDAMRTAAGEGLGLRAWCADLTQTPLPQARFDLIVVTRYLQRDLFPSLREALVPAGVILYETFTVAQRALGRGPTSPDHLLEPGELRDRFEGFDVLFYEEAAEPDAVARIAARRSA